MARTLGRALTAFALALGAVIIFAGCDESGPAATLPDATSAPGPMARVGSPAPDIIMTNPETGEVTRLSDLRGQVVFVNFWGTWCPPCRAELPDIVSLHEQYKDQGVAFLGVLVHRNPSNATEVGPMVARYGIRYKNVTGTQSAFMAYGIQAVPSTYIVDAQGVVRQQFVGGRDRATFERGIRMALSS